jgi:hypothetical protein
MRRLSCAKSLSAKSINKADSKEKFHTSQLKIKLEKAMFHIDSNAPVEHILAEETAEGF